MQTNCKTYKKIRDTYGLGYEKNTNLLKSSYIRNTIKDVLSNAVFPEDVESNTVNYFNAHADEFEWRHPAQAKYHAFDAARQIRRYTSSETRKPYYYDGKIVSVQGHSAFVNPSEIFITTNSDSERFIEVVKLKCSKPYLTQKSADTGKENALELYELLCYGRTLLSKKGTEHVTASFYYLKKNTDRNPSPGETLGGNFDKNFFSVADNFSVAKGAGNIVRLTESYRNGLLIQKEYDEKHHKSVQLINYDKLFTDTVNTYFNGKDAAKCTPADCEKCPINAMCKYTLPPLGMGSDSQTMRKNKRMHLTPEQQKASNYDHGIVRINAGAGTGKTNTVKSHFVSLCDKGYDPKKILVITFTNSAAEEMRTRIVSGLTRNGIDVDPNKLWISTFNAFGNLLVEHNYALLGYSAAPKLIDDVERSSLISSVLRSVPEISGLDYRNFSTDDRYCKGALGVAKRVFTLTKKYQLSYADAAKCTDLLKTKYGCMIPVPTCKTLMKLYDSYDDTLRSSNLIEYDDQISLLFELVYHDPAFMEKLGFEHIIVDEFQDTDQQQIDILKLLINTPSFKSLMVVGDDSQAIYGFRDTSPDYIIHFEDYISQPIDDVYLLDNFRCTPEIIHFANEINAMNTNRIAKDLKPTRKSGDPVTVVGFCDNKDEYQYIVNQIKQNIADGVKPENIAFIGYSKNELKKMADLLTKENIESVMMNPEPLLENSRVQAGLALLNVLQNPADKKSLLIYTSALSSTNIINTDYTVGKNELNEVSASINECRKLREKQKKIRILEMLREIDRNDDEVFASFIKTIEFKPTVDLIYEYARDFEEFGSNAEYRRNHNYPGVVLTTCHSSKGLEWSYIYLTLSKFDTPEIHNSLPEVEERRRLLFVSATRAKDRLIVTSTFTAFNEPTENPKVTKPVYNRFLNDSLKANGDPVSPKEYKAIIDLYKELKKIERKKAKLKAEKEKLILPKSGYESGRRTKRSLRKPGKPWTKRWDPTTIFCGSPWI